MGDRGNIAIVQEAHEGKRALIYLYSHWGGTGMTATLQAALKRGKSRWDDPAYLARIIFCEMIRGQEQELNGFGISNGICDNEHPILYVDPDAETVSLGTAESDRGLSFADFCALDADAIAHFRGEEEEG